MALTLSEIEAQLRRSLGSPSTTALSADQLSDAVQSAVREYSKARPAQVIGSLTTIKDTADYDLSAKARIIRVKEVFWSSNPEFRFEDFPSEMMDAGRLAGLSIFDNPSLWTQFMQRLEQYRNIFDGDFEYDRAGKILTLIPAPSESGSTVYYVWLQRHAASETGVSIPEDDLDVFLLWAKAECKEAMAGRKAEMILSVSGYGESVQLGATSKDLMDQAKDLKLEFRQRMKGLSVVIG